MIRYRFNARANILSILLFAVPLIITGGVVVGIFDLLSVTDVSGRFFFLCLALFATASAFLVCLYALFVIFTLHYAIERDTLTLFVGLKKYRLPLSLVEVKKYKKRAMTEYWQNFRGGSTGTSVWAAACFPLVDQVIYLQCQDREIVINPTDHVGFLSALYRVSKLRELDPQAQKMAAGTATWQVSSTFSIPAVARDRIFSRLWLLNIGLLISLTGLVMQGIGYLPHLTVMRYTLTQGILLDGINRDSVLAYAGILWIMFSSLTVFSMVVHRYERLASYLSLGFFPFIQIVVFVAVYGLFRVAG